jgi:hypothetical protein
MAVRGGHLGALGLVVAMSLAACGGGEAIVEPIVPPTVDACSAGALEAGQVAEGTFSATSCTVPFHFVSRTVTPYVGYGVSLERGRGYWFHLTKRPDANGLNEVDALLTLWGEDDAGRQVPLAVSDDAGTGPNFQDAEIYFVAPRSGTFELAASSFDLSALGGYRLSMAECPVVARLGSAGTYDGLRYGASDCLRHNMASVDASSRLALVSIEAAPFEEVRVTVTSNDFFVLTELGGPDFDVYGSVRTSSLFTSAVGSPASVLLTTGAVGGTLTLAVGSPFEFEAGDFRVVLARAPLPTPPAVR